MIISPCISICKTDPSTGYCYGCGRSNDEKRLWELEETTDDWKKENIMQIEKRLTGWQLESFKESYSYKITDLSVKKKNSYVRNIYEEDGKILTLKHGYPQFYTQILFEKNKPEIFVKAVLNDIESLSKISTCKKIEKFDQES